MVDLDLTADIFSSFARSSRDYVAVVPRMNHNGLLAPFKNVRCFFIVHFLDVLRFLTMSKSRKAAVCATAAAFIVGTESASASTHSSSFSHGGSATRILCSEDGNGLDGLNVYSCPRGGAKPDESQKKRKGRRRKTEKPTKVETSETTDDVPQEDVESSTSTAAPAQEDTQSQSPQQEASASAEKEKPDAPKPKSKQQQKSQTPPPPTAIIDEILKEKDYYKILGTTKQEAQSNSNPNNVIQKAYRRRAVHCHPDKTGGDRRAFDRVAEAYDVLSDDSKRQIYDRFGKEGLDPTRANSAANRSQQSAGFGNGGGAEDIFRAFFGGSGTRYQQPAPRRNRSVRYQLEVTLEDLYLGMERTVLVAAPDGGGSSTTANKRVHVNVPRGAVSGQSIVLSGEMDFDEDDTPGDLVFWLRERSHATFTRKGHDLAVAFQITLQEAICGVTRSIRHLDGSELNIVSAQHATHGPILIQTGDVQVLKGKGMPKDGQGVEFGDLYVQYQVEMPTGKPNENTLTSEEREELGRLLDKLQGTKHTPATDQSDVQFLQKASLRDFGRASGQPQPPQNNDPRRDSTFGSRQFYSSSSRASNPFFELNQDYMPDGDDDSNVQCRPM
jgi:DnaJ-class molecular chaperone